MSRQRFFIGVAAGFVLLTTVVLGQEQGRQPATGTAPEGKSRAGRPAPESRERAGLVRQSASPEEQLKAVDVIAEQIGKLKAAIQITVGQNLQKLQEMTAEERAKIRQTVAKAYDERRKALDVVEQQLSKLRVPRPPARPVLAAEDRAELNEILELAKKEKAEQTALRLQKLLEKYQRIPQGSVPESREPGERLPRPQRDQLQEQVKTQDAQARMAPQFSLTSFDGKSVSLADYKGKIVVLEWFNFECPFSLYHYQTKKTMIELADKYKEKGVVWLAVNSTNHTTPQANKDFAAKYKLPYPMLDDRAGKVGHTYDARTTPHIIVISSRGRIVYDGAIDNAPNGQLPTGQQLVNYVDQALSELISGKDISTPKTKPYGCTVKYAQ